MTSMLSPKKGAAAPVVSKHAGTGGSAASSNQLSGGLKVQTSLPTKLEDKSSTPKKDADRKVGSSPAPAGHSGTPSTASPKQARGAYESPNSPIASASKRASGKVVSTTKPKLKAAPPAPPAAAGNTKVVSRKLELDHDSHGQNGNPVPMAGVSAPGAPAYGMNGTGGSHNGSTSGSEGKNETIFSPAYLAKQAEEKKKEEAAALAAAEKAAAESKMPRIPNSAKPKQKKKKEETKKEVQKSQQPVPQPQPEEDMDDDYALDEDEFDPFLFIKNLPPLSPAMRNRKSPLPKKSKKAPPISLALDLDETLVHCSVQPIEKAELTFSVNFNGLDYEVYVRTRPHLQTFLKQVSEWFEIIVFTASQKVYADKLLNILDPNKEYIKHRVFRDSCVCVDGNYLKDLTILGRDLKKVAIVDNSVQAFGFQLDNGIPIESWFDDDNDNELLNLIPFLRTLKDVQDVRPLIRQTFRLQEFVNSL